MPYTIKQINKALSLFDQIENATLVCRQLGYPSISVLYSWIRKRRKNNGVFPDFESRFKHKISSTPKFSTYSAEDKLIIQKRCFEGTEYVRDVAEELNITTATIYRWRKILLSKGAAGLIAKPSKKIKRDKGSIDKAIAESENISSETTSKTSENEQIKALKKEIEELLLKVDVMTEVLNVLKKDQGINLKELTNKEKLAVVNALKSRYKLATLLKILDFSKSSYFYALHAANKSDKYQKIKEYIRNIFYGNYKCYGYRRVNYVLKSSYGITISEKIIRRLTSDDGLNAKSCRRRRYSSYLGEISTAAENIVNRDFSADKPNQKWLTDISEFAIASGKLYLSIIRDCYNDEIISWKIGKRASARPANATLENAIRKTKCQSTIVHSDRGCHYRWPEWIKIIVFTLCLS